MKGQNLLRTQKRGIMSFLFFVILLCHLFLKETMIDMGVSQSKSYMPYHLTHFEHFYSWT
jgi:hypothetical protein